MIVPITTEDAWHERLQHLPRWHPPHVHTLIVSPHPDDETLGCGGLIADLCACDVPVVIAAVTDGEAAYSGTAGLGEIREKEHAAAAQHLGVAAGDVHRMRLPDSGLAAHEDVLVDRLEALCTPDTHILAPWTGDFHPDHEVCGRAAHTAAQRTGASVTYYFFWTWHRGTPELLADLPLVMLPLSPRQLQVKSGALACHHSQLSRDGGEPILADNLLWPAKRPYEVFLPA